MKTLAIITFLSAAFSGSASAGSCSGGTGNAGYVLFTSGITPLGSNAITCAVTAPVNTYITSVTVITISDLTNPASNPSFNLTTSAFGTAYTGTTNGTLGLLTPSPVTITGANQAVSIGGLTGNSDQSLSGVTLSFSVTSAKTPGFVGTANGTSLDAAGIFGVSGNATGVQSGIFFTYAPTRQAVPEPATLSLIGAGLVGVSLLSRRRK